MITIQKATKPGEHLNVIDTIINQNDLNQTDIQEYHALIKKLADYNTDLLRFARSFGDGESLVDLDNAVLPEGTLDDLFENYYMPFVHAFSEKYGLMIHLEWHDPYEDGLPYDDVHGAFFSLVNTQIYNLSEKAIRLKEDIDFSQKTYTIL